MQLKQQDYPESALMITLKCPNCDGEGEGDIEITPLKDGSDLVELSCEKCNAIWLDTPKEVKEPTIAPFTTLEGAPQRIASALERIATALEGGPLLRPLYPPIPEPPGVPIMNLNTITPEQMAAEQVTHNIEQLFDFSNTKRHLKGQDFPGRDNMTWMEEE